MDKHVLSNKDLESKTADCSVCGPRVPCKVRRERDGWVCRTVVRRYDSSRPSRNRQRRYGITDEEHSALVSKQGGLCAICRKPPQGRDLHVDHDHSTGRVRGLLCFPCNVGLGQFGDDLDTMRAAVDYLAAACPTPLVAT